MNISIDPLTFIIYIPKAEMTLVQSLPTEVRELNLNTFRLALKDWEDGDGITFLKTHSHNTEVSLSGITFARVIEILSPYTITFEDGQYAVNLTGANSNVGDRVNLNQVSVRSANSAGLISTPLIEYSSFEGGVWVNTTTTNTGTAFPTGTKQKPVNNLTDAMLIASYRGFKKLYFLSDITLNTPIDLDNFILQGESESSTSIVLGEAVDCHDLTIISANVSGTLDGRTTIDRCNVGDLVYMNGYIKNSGLYGTIYLGGGEEAIIESCYTIDQDSMPVIDMGGSGQDLSMPNYSGLIIIKNLSSATEEIGIGLLAGAVTLDSTITAGTIIVSGVGLLYNNATGTANVNTDGLLSKQLIASAVEEQIGEEIQYASFNEQVTLDTVNGTDSTVYPYGTGSYPCKTLANALSIATTRGFNVIHLLSELTIANGDNVDGFRIKSDNYISVVVEAGASLNDTIFEKLDIDGVMSGYWNIFEDCWLNTITNFTGWMRGGSFTDITLAPYTPTIPPSDYALGHSFFDDIVPMYPNVEAVLTMNTDTSVAFSRVSDIYKVKNCTSGSICSVGLTRGKLIIDSTCTGGDIIVSGIGELEDNSNGSTVDITGFVQAELIQYASFNGGITIDAVNGVNALDYPAGTPAHPVKTCEYAITLAQNKNFKTFYVIGTLTTGVYTMDGYTVRGEGDTKTHLIINNTTCIRGRIYDCKVTGTFGNGSRVQFSECKLGDVGSGLYNITVDAHNCSLSGTIELNDTEDSNFYNCNDGVPGSGTPVIEVNDCESLGFWNYSGGVKLTNMITPGVTVSFNAPAGRLIVDSTDTQGTIVARGIGSISGTTGGTVITQDDLLSRSTISDAIWDDQTSEHVTAGTMGKALSDAGSAGNPWSSLVASNQDPNTFGEFVSKKLLKKSQFLALK